MAEAIAIDVKGWGLSYGMFEDNPDKVAGAPGASEPGQAPQHGAARPIEPGSLRHHGEGISRARAGREA